MTEVFFTVLIYAAVVLGSWFVLALLIGLVVGKSVALADRHQAHPEPESLRDAA
jgi:hypothetical protein